MPCNYNKKGKNLNESERASKRSTRGYSDRKSRDSVKKSDKKETAQSQISKEMIKKPIKRVKNLI